MEDHEDSLATCSMFLSEKYAVFGYASAVEALQAIDVAMPDVLVLDIGMHPVDGLQCLKMIRATPGRHDIPAVAMTAFAHDVERQSFLEAGFEVVIVKPVDPLQLTAVIDRLAAAAVRRLDAGAATTASETDVSAETARGEPS